jgi:hypothetical protein
MKAESTTQEPTPVNNRIFNVNGRGSTELEHVLQLAFNQCHPNTRATHYLTHPQKGMILLSYGDKNAHPFPAPLTAQTAASQVWNWLQSNPECECIGWDKGIDDSDVTTKIGWRVYCEDWGHVDHNHAAIIAIKPAWLWYGK